MRRKIYNLKREIKFDKLNEQTCAYSHELTWKEQLDNMTCLMGPSGIDN